MKIDLIVAARPNFMKIAPLYHQLKDKDRYKLRIVHTGQHFDKNMSDDFFSDLNLKKPDVHLGVSGGSHAEQVANVMVEYERICLENKPDLVIVVGDVNATMACSITAKKLDIKVAHLEAGIRSNDMTMPEEINRKVTDSIVDFFWTPSIDANENLVREGILSKKIFFVGNIMIDSLELKREEIESINYYEKLNLQKKEYATVTFHRPSNVDLKNNLEKIVSLLNNLSQQMPIVFPVHPRTKASLERFKLIDSFEPNIILLEPQNYVSFMNLIMNSKLLLTDSGGIQEETTYLKVPCLTLRENTERPITVDIGTNTLVSFDNAQNHIDEVLNGTYKKGEIPLLWDGDTAKRIGQLLDEL